MGREWPEVPAFAGTHTDWPEGPAFAGTHHGLGASAFAAARR
jgi:hypothetical protein